VCIVTFLALKVTAATDVLFLCLPGQRRQSIVLFYHKFIGDIYFSFLPPTAACLGSNTVPYPKGLRTAVGSEDSRRVARKVIKKTFK
jgi:hypothetical protein